MNAEEIEVIACYQRLRSPFRVAGKLGMGTARVLQILADNPLAASLSTVSACVETHGGFGRPELVQYTVARKRPTPAWENDSPEIRLARKNYEAGTHELATGRDGDWLILYSIPRRAVAPGRSTYFSVTHSAV